MVTMTSFNNGCVASGRSKIAARTHIVRPFLIIVVVMSSVLFIHPSAQAVEKKGDFPIVDVFKPKHQDGTSLVDGVGGVISDGNHLWLSGSHFHRVYRINLTTKQVTANWPVPFEPGSIAWDGSLIWVVDQDSPRKIVAYDTNGKEQQFILSPIVCSALTWDGSHFWANRWELVVQFDRTGLDTKVFTSAWFGIDVLGFGVSLSWDGESLWAFGDQPQRIDPSTGNVISSHSFGLFAKHQFACDARRRLWSVEPWLFIATADPQEITVTKLEFPNPQPFKPLYANWGDFGIDDWFGLPGSRDAFHGSGLGIHGNEVLYSNVPGVNGATKPPGTNALAELTMTFSPGANDVATDGQHVWTVGNDRLRQYELKTRSVSSFDLEDGLDEGVAWDGESLWVCGLRGVGRYGLNGKQIAFFQDFGKVNGYTLSGGTDLAWHDGDLWALGTYSGFVVRIQPESGNLLAMYKIGDIPFNQEGLASDGTNLFVCASFKKTLFTTDSLPCIARLRMPKDTAPPSIIAMTATPGIVSLAFSEDVRYKFGTLPLEPSKPFLGSSFYQIESPIGVPIDTSLAKFAYNSSNYSVAISGLNLPTGKTIKTSVKGILDSAGNFIRQNGTDNVQSRTVHNPVRLSIAKPLNNDIVRTSTISMNLSVQDDGNVIARMDILDNGNVVATSLQKPYDILINGLAIGQHSLLARATDVARGETYSQAVQIRIDAANDAFADRIPLSGFFARTTASNVTATKEPGEPLPAFFPVDKSLWWSWTAPIDGLVTISTECSFGHVLAIYTGEGLSDLRFVARAESPFSGFSAGSAQVSIPAKRGAQYQIQVIGSFRNSGDIRLTLSQAPPKVNLAIYAEGPRVRIVAEGAVEESLLHYEASEDLRSWKTVEGLPTKSELVENVLGLSRFYRLRLGE